MKINEVAIREAEPNYEVDPAQSRLAAIANKLMDKSATTTDERLSIALSKVAYHLSDYGTSFGPKTIQQLLDMVNGEGKYAPDADMPQDNKNPTKVTKQTLMKMMDFGQKMLDKEGTAKPDDVEVNEAETTVKGKPYSAYFAKAQLREISEARRMLENEIIKLGDLDNGDLTDQITTMFNANTKMSGAIRRAYAIIPEDPRDHMNEAEHSPNVIAQLKKKYDELEDGNHHGEAALLLVNAFGDKQELDIITAINARHKKRGSIMPAERQLRDEIAQNYYKMLMGDMVGVDQRNEGVISDLFTTTTDEKRSKQATGDAYDAMRVDKETAKFQKQGLSDEDARKYAYRKVHGKPLDEGKLSVNKIHKAVDDGKSMDVIVGMFADNRTTNTDDIRKIVKDYKFKSRIKKKELDEVVPSPDKVKWKPDPKLKNLRLSNIPSTYEKRKEALKSGAYEDATADIGGENSTTNQKTKRILNLIRANNPTAKNDFEAVLLSLDKAKKNLSNDGDEEQIDALRQDVDELRLLVQQLKNKQSTVGESVSGVTPGYFDHMKKVNKGEVNKYPMRGKGTPLSQERKDALFGKKKDKVDKVDEVAGPDKCWDGYKPGNPKTKAGTGKNAGKRVNNCVPV